LPGKPRLPVTGDGPKPGLGNEEFYNNILLLYFFSFPSPGLGTHLPGKPRLSVTGDGPKPGLGNEEFYNNILLLYFFSFPSPGLGTRNFMIISYCYIFKLQGDLSK